MSQKRNREANPSIEYKRFCLALASLFQISDQHLFWTQSMFNPSHGALTPSLALYHRESFFKDTARIEEARHIERRRVQHKDPGIFPTPWNALL